MIIKDENDKLNNNITAIYKTFNSDSSLFVFLQLQYYTKKALYKKKYILFENFNEKP